MLVTSLLITVLLIAILFITILSLLPQVFGAILSHGLHTDKLTTYYGTGETFLFTFHPDFEVFKWSGVNTFFIKSGPDYISIGGGEYVSRLFGSLDFLEFPNRSIICE